MYTINDAIDLLAYLFESDTSDIEQTIDEYLAVVQKNHTLETDEHGNMLLPKTAVDRLVDLHVDSIETQSLKHLSPTQNKTKRPATQFRK